MSTDLPDDNQIESLKDSLAETRKELDEYKSENPELLQPVEKGEDVLDKILDKGIKAFEIWTKEQSSVKRHQSDNDHSIDSKKLELLDKSDIRNKNIGTIIVISALIVIVVLSLMDKYSTGVATTIGFIIASVFSDKISKTVSEITNTFKRSKKIDD